MRFLKEQSSNLKSCAISHQNQFLFVTITLRHVWFPHYSWYIKIWRKNCVNVSLSCCMSQPLVWYLGRLLSDTPQPATIDLSNDFCSAGGEFSQRGASTNIFQNILKVYISKYFERIYLQIFWKNIFPNILKECTSKYLEILYFQIIYKYIPNKMLFL